MLGNKRFKVREVLNVWVWCDLSVLRISRRLDTVCIAEGAKSVFTSEVPRYVAHEQLPLFSSGIC